MGIKSFTMPEDVEVFQENKDGEKKHKPFDPAKFVNPTNDFGKPKLTGKQEARSDALEKAPLNPWVASALRGASFGLSDRAIAKGRSMMNGDDNYRRYLEEQFAQRDAFNDEHPVASIATEIGGGLVTGGPLVSGVKAGVGALAPRVAAALSARGLLPAIGRGAGVLGGGAAMGATSGAGQAEYGEAGQGAATGALTGAAVSGALQGAGKVGKAIYEKGLKTPLQHVGNVLGTTRPDKWAQDEWLKSVGLDGDDLTGLVHKLRSKDPDGQAGLRAMDVAGINAKSKLKSASIPETGAKAELDQLFEARRLEQPEKLGEALRKGVSPRVDAANVADEIYETGRKKADPLYAKLSQMGQIDDDSVTAWLNATPDRRHLLNEYASMLEGRGQPMSSKYGVDDKGFLVKERAPTWDDLHNMYKHIGDLKNKAYETGTSKKINGHDYDSYALGNEHRSMRELLDNLSPKDADGVSIFSQARKIAGDSAEIRKALQSGRDLFKGNTGIEDIKHAMKDLTSDAEVEAFRTGVASELYKSISSKGGKDATNVLVGKGMNDKINLIFPDGDAAEYFSRTVGAEHTKAETARQLAPRVSANAAAFMNEAPNANALGAAVGAFQGRPVQSLGMLQRAFSKDWEKAMPDYADPLLRFGMMGGDEMSKLAAEIAAKQNGALSKFGRVGQAVGGSALGATPGVVGSSAAGRGGDVTMGTELDDIFGPGD